ncbi:DUF6361 family protein [Thalassoroseus pseudoceratinae]|uniref:DUF6361 family protein n=1 Tax=Thalassoroseus pseudoceratinae TaxID=2713176 RepID=UPI001421394F|nr:DUF6361 family protein [Thalassoroseus pseudoceratinae]
MSAIGWVDFSSEHREKVKSVIDLLSTPGVVDELGIGVIRDSFSDSLFPGISTIQTRAKYFLTVPRIFKDYEKLPAHKRRRRKLADYLNDHENQCMEWMVENHYEDPQDGIIGESFANKQGEVQRKPSSAYWTGIRQFGLIRTNLSLQVFCRRFANPDQPLRDLVEGNDKLKGDDPDASEQANETINGPDYEDDWIEDLTIHLSHEEASFLSRQIEARVPLSLLGQILLDSDVRRKFLDLPSDWNFTTLADEAKFLDQFPEKLQRTIATARDFWQLMYGAHIRYNCLLQEKHGTSGLRDEFEGEWAEWLAELQSFPWQRWDTGRLWEQTKLHHRRVKEYTIDFVQSWIDGVCEKADTDHLDKLVTKQERFNKKGRARLQPTADESVGKWIGIADLNYRLTQARTIIRDIDRGLAASEGDDAGY